MSAEHEANLEDPSWPELNLSELLLTGKIRDLHAVIEKEWDTIRRSACQMAAVRAMWRHVIRDPLAELLAGETYLRNLYEKMKKDRLNNAKEISGVILAVRTLWIDSKLEIAIRSFNGDASQVVLLGAGMDTRAYRLTCLKETDVFEIDFPDVLQMKNGILDEAIEQTNGCKRAAIISKSLSRIEADISDDNWLKELLLRGFSPEKKTVWILEGILYYLTDAKAMEVLKIIADNSAIGETVLLADFMNKPSTMLSSSVFHFYCDWPEELLPSLGFSDVNLSQIGDQDAHFGLLPDPLNLFNKLLNLPRSLQNHPDDGTPCCRLYLVEARYGSPNRSSS
ncbi:putative S-adenosyl-L-methionine-dependent methyltransferase Mvan_0910 [Impatiens glandulifera]|uniref:putative S-adenosyl-L-methionine-dependent methyltransferase Mvan_0910 n=1 Tax=Impatiens glandulifera TaxID=253017 RepID=UPI001FB19573|nr:putative S-adenosyl-L-methionine-dependent methyltransferase Mvan_0910 [Impatiens glandulifera]